MLFMSHILLGESAALDIIVFKWWAAKSINHMTTRYQPYPQPFERTHRLTASDFPYSDGQVTVSSRQSRGEG